MLVKVVGLVFKSRIAENEVKCQTHRERLAPLRCLNNLKMGS